MDGQALMRDPRDREREKMLAARAQGDRPRDATVTEVLNRMASGNGERLLMLTTRIEGIAERLVGPVPTEPSPGRLNGEVGAARPTLDQLRDAMESTSSILARLESAVEVLDRA